MSKKITLAEIQAMTTYAVTNNVLEDVYKDIDKKITEAAQKGHHEAKYHIPYDYMEYLSVIRELLITKVTSFSLNTTNVVSINELSPQFLQFYYNLSTPNLIPFVLYLMQH